jgi:hypothetical protein
MNNFNKALLGLLVIQALIVGVLYFPRGEESASVEPLLPDFDKSAVRQIEIADNDGNRLRLAQDSAGAWVLPEADNFPVNATTVTTLLDKLTGLQTNRLITRSETSHRRLQVGQDDFNRAVTLTQGEETTTLYIGSSGGANATHARLNGEDDVYLVGNLSANDANPQVSAWIDTLYFSATATEAIRLTLQNTNGTFEFTKNAEGVWQLDGLAGAEVLNDAAFQTFLNQATQLRMSRPLGQSEDESYAMSAPTASLTITVRQQVVTPSSPDPALSLEATESATDSAEDATPQATLTPSATPEPVFEEITYTVLIGANLVEENGYVAKASESDYYVLLSTVTAEAFTAKTRENFVTLPTPTPTPLASPTVEATATPEASPTLESTVTPEPSLTLEPESTEEAASATPRPSATP